MKAKALVNRIVLGAAAALLLAAGVAFAQPPASYELALVGLDGDKEIVGLLPGTVFAPRLSPDGAQVAFEIIEPPGGGGSPSARVWVAALAKPDDRRALPLVEGPMNWAPLWTPDGERIAFLVNGAAPDTIYWQRADGSGGAEHLVDGRSGEGWTGGGSHLTYLTLTGDRDYGISALDIGAGTTAALIDSPGSAQHSSNVSRDGRFIAYASNETGRYEVWVEPLPQTGERFRITADGGGHPLWSPDGRTIYFDRDQQLFRVSVDPAAGMRAGQPEPLPISGFAQGEYRRQFDLLPDGRRFLMLFPSSHPVD